MHRQSRRDPARSVVEFTMSGPCRTAFKPRFRSLGRALRGRRRAQPVLHGSDPTGSVRVMVVPLPEADSAEMVPPCASRTVLAIASPRPRPPFAASRPGSPL